MRNRLILLVIAVVSLFTAFSASSQEYQPRDKWPYLNRDFVNGEVRTASGNLLMAAKMNICIADGKLHYLQNDVIMQADMSTVSTVKIDSSLYQNVYGRLMKVLAYNENGTALLDVKVDEDALQKSDIGYGISSATASSQRLRAIVDELSLDVVNMNISNILPQKEQGNPLPVKEVYYLKVGADVLPATRREVQNLSSVDAEKAKAFFKQNKIKWNDSADLLKVVDFIASQK